MPRRVTLTDRQKDALLRLPTSQTDLLKHYTLSDEDLGHIRLCRRAHNRFGFALQLCVLRYPGRVLAPGELIPAEGSVAKIVKLEHAWRRLDGRNDDGFQVAPFPG